MPKFASPEEINTTYPASQLIRDVWGYLKPARGQFLLASFIKLTSDLADLYPTYAFAQLLNILADPNAKNISAVKYLIFWYALAILWQAVAGYLWHALGDLAINRVAANMETAALNRLFMIDIAWHEKENSGNKIKRIQNGVSGVTSILRIWQRDILSIAINMVGVVLIISNISPGIAMIVAVFALSYYGLSKSFTKRIAGSVHEVNLQNEAISGLSFQAVSNIRTVKAMGMRRALMDIVQTNMAELLRRSKRRILLMQTRASALQSWSMITRLSTLIYLIFGVINGAYQIGFLVMFNNYFSRIRELTLRLSDVGQELLIARYSVGRLQETMGQPVSIDDDNGKSPIPENWQQLTLKQVSFAYHDRTVLDNISFTLRRGEKLGIVGLSGAGKSTLFKLLLKEYENFSGEILFDNTPIQKIAKSSYFTRVAVSLQDTEVFNFSLKDNITLANMQAAGDSALLDKALSTANMHDFLKKLPQGMDSLIGEKGVKLSGGERQRLGIARAIFKEPELLLMDEATSHLDLESEEKIRQTLHEFFKNITAIVIAHRLTTIREMDRILVIEDGRLMEQGSFEELMGQQGRFAQLWEKQKL